MNTRRWRVWLVIGAAMSVLAVIFWAGYVFSAIWLRVRYARELADHVEPLHEVQLSQRANSEGASPDASADLGAHIVLVDFAYQKGPSALSRLEALQRPSVGTVVRLLIDRKRSDDSSELLWGQTIAMNPAGQILAASGANSPTFVFSDGPDTATIDVAVTNPTSTVSAGQTLASIVLWNSGPTTHCYSVTDSSGDKLLALTRPLNQHASEAQMPDSSPGLEILLIDSAGRVLDRSRVPGSSLLGRLAEPRGKADQLVFGTPSYESQDGTFDIRAVGPGAVCIVEDGQLKTVRTIDPPGTSVGHSAPGESQSN
jgi:hypothetical protein